MNAHTDIGEQATLTSGERASAVGSLTELTRRNVESMRALERAAARRRSRMDVFAAFIANFCGSMTFVWVHVAFFGAWIIANTVPGIAHFDAYPFTFLTLIVSLEAIFLSSFILISQNHEMRISEQRNRLDLQINLISEQENTKMLALLERIALHVGATSGFDPEIRALEQATRPEALTQQIDDAERDHRGSIPD